MAPLPGTSGGDANGALSKSKVINDTKWIVYCCCEGWGLGPFADPLIAAEAKQLCLRSSVSTTDIMADDGLCHQVQVCFCITQHCSMPPAADAPACALCNMKFGGPLGQTKFPDGIFEKSKIMDDTFWIHYCLCSGCGINKMDQGLFTNQFKELCCRGYTNVEAPIVDGVLCSSVGTELCIWSECQMPPTKPNPTIALCTWRLNKDKHGSPAQMEMK
mmetsp:Transcript_3771/g.5190  ORF Transcript_3771/g.5190 Transcript_3771/m.5190 type:complete len:217 (-) Transcript_3771:379-1029(-)